MGRGNRAKAGLFSRRRDSGAGVKRREQAKRPPTSASIGSIEGSRYAYRLRVLDQSGQLVGYHEIEIEDDSVSSNLGELSRRARADNHQAEVVIVEETADEDALVWRELAHSASQTFDYGTSRLRTLDWQLKEMDNISDIPTPERKVLEDGRIAIKKVRAAVVNNNPYALSSLEKEVLDSQTFDPVDPKEAKQALDYYNEIHQQAIEEKIKRQEMLDKKKQEESDPESLKKKRLQAIKELDQDLDPAALAEREADIKASHARQKINQAKRELAKAAHDKEAAQKSKATRSSRWNETASGIGRL
jgi:hypothetical protein